MLTLPGGAHLDGDHETVWLSFDSEEAGGDGVFPADLAEATGLPEIRVKEVLDDLVAQDVLATTEHHDDTYGVRYVRSRGA